EQGEFVAHGAASGEGVLRIISLRNVQSRQDLRGFSCVRLPRVRCATLGCGVVPFQGTWEMMGMPWSAFAIGAKPQATLGQLNKPTSGLPEQMACGRFSRSWISRSGSRPKAW